MMRDAILCYVGRVDGWLTHNRIDGRLRRARDFIYSAYAQRLDLPTISKQAQLSPFHFLRSFRSAFELTPHEYLI